MAVFQPRSILLFPCALTGQRVAPLQIRVGVDVPRIEDAQAAALGDGVGQRAAEARAREVQLLERGDLRVWNLFVFFRMFEFELVLVLVLVTKGWGAQRRARPRATTNRPAQKPAALGQKKPQSIAYKKELHARTRPLSPPLLPRPHREHAARQLAGRRRVGDVEHFEVILPLQQRAREGAGQVGVAEGEALEAGERVEHLVHVCS